MFGRWAGDLITTTIVPASGAAPLYTQQGTGTTPGYSALDDRRAVLSTLVEGVYGSLTAVTAGGVGGVTRADFLVTQRNAGANMSVDVNMPAGGFAWVQGDTINGQALYMVPVAGSNINEVIAGSDPTNPRIDQVILEIQDNVLDASGGNLARTRVLTGTPTTGATLVNRTGAVALPGNALLLADILVPATSTSVPTSNTNDRRTYARGTDTGWLAISPGASCSIANGLGARTLGNNLLIDTQITCTANTTSGTSVIGTLPVGARPPTRALHTNFVGLNYGGVVVSSSQPVTLNTSGTIVPDANGAITSNFFLIISLPVV